MNDPNVISYKHPTLQDIEGLLEIAEDLWIGKRSWFDDTVPVASGSSVYKAWKATNRAYRYLPMGDGEKTENYLDRLIMSRFEKYFRTAIERDYASILSRFTISDLHPAIQPWLNNFDRRGNSIHVFAHDWISYALRDGMAGVFLDYPRIPEGMSLAEIQGASLRPYPVLYQRKDVTNWAYEFDDYGQPYLTRLVLRDKVPVPDGKYGIKIEEQYKHLFIGEDGFQYCERIGVERNPDHSELEYLIEPPFRTGVNYIAFIPLGLSADPFNADLPLEDLMDLNVSHYRKQSDIEWYEHLCSAPTLLIRELNPSQSDPTQTRSVKLGPHSVIYNREAEWLGLDAAKMAGAKETLVAIEEKIQHKTLAFLSGNSAPTATQAILESTQTQANVLGMAEFIESAFQTLFKMWADYVLIDPVENAGTISLEQTLGLVKMAIIGDAKDVIVAFKENLLSRSLSLKLLNNRGFFGNDFSDDDLLRELSGTDVLNTGGEAIPEDAVPLGL